MEDCLEAVYNWLRDRRLKLNPAKTEMIVFSRHNLSHAFRVIFRGSQVTARDSVSDLGVKITSSLSCEGRVGQITSSCFWSLRLIKRLRPRLTDDTVREMTVALVLSKLDFANSLLVGASEAQIRRLQKCQNAAARLVARLPWRAHVTPVLAELHWLPVRLRIVKVVLLVFKCISGSAPQYLSDLVTESRSARLAEARSLMVIPATSKSAERSFARAGVKAWNALPVWLRRLEDHSTFTAELKTHLFRRT
jgi:hypothetical protein